MKNLLKEHKDSNELGLSLRKEAVRYIERCHLEDGGYFFARVLPSGGMDTYFAVKSLSILGVKPDRQGAIERFLFGEMKEGQLNDIAGLFTASEVFSDLGLLTHDFSLFARERIMRFRNEAGGFGVTDGLDVEVTSELQDTYRAVRVMLVNGGEPDVDGITRFLSTFLNRDGGYGRAGRSTLASTYYSTEIHRLLGRAQAGTGATVDYLRDVEAEWASAYDSVRVTFVEDLFWLVKSMANLGGSCAYPDKVKASVLACQRENGGFSRAAIMGIPTLEYTYYALSLLKEIGLL